MIFSSNIFIYYFLPACLALYYLVGKRYRNALLLAFSLLFYAWGDLRSLPLLVGSIVLNYAAALLIETGKKRSRALAVTTLVLAILANVGVLAYYKYTNFAIKTLNNFMGTSFGLREIVLPLAISFFTLQAVAYIVDVYKGRINAQRNPVNVALFMAFFPQLLSGPIVRYDQMSLDIVERSESLELFASGLKRFVIGLAKKAVFAGALGALADAAHNDVGSLTVLSAWVGAIAYTLQIYFDFSGYSDMAVGLGRMFGFHLPENFDHPYVSRSATEFWRRWHMTLGSWFRDYIYIPMGGNRCGRGRQYFNLAVVWFLTGLWHGASWNFIFWGLFYLVLLVVEKSFLLKWLNRSQILSRIYLILATVFGWVLFRAASLRDAIAYVKAMFGMDGVPLWNTAAAADLYLNHVLLVFAVLFCLPIINWLRAPVAAFANRSRPRGVFVSVAVLLAILATLIVSLAAVSSSDYSAFVYLNF